VGFEESIKLEAVLLPGIVSLSRVEEVDRHTWDIALPTYLEVVLLIHTG
jgi:hypothetical protein